MNRSACGPRDDVPDLRRSNIRGLQTAIARARASPAEATASRVGTCNTLDGDQKSSSVLIDYATVVGATDMAHEARHRSETTVVAQGAPIATITERGWRWNCGGAGTS